MPVRGLYCSLTDMSNQDSIDCILLFKVKFAQENLPPDGGHTKEVSK